MGDQTHCPRMQVNHHGEAGRRCRLSRSEDVQVQAVLRPEHAPGIELDAWRGEFRG